jgi:hypothetical protein
MKMTSAALRFVAVTLLLVGAGPAWAGDNLLTTPGAAARAAGETVAKIGRSPSISLIEITPDAVTLDVQGDKPFHVDEWRWSLLDLWLFEKSSVSGPQPVEPSAPVKDISASFFPLSDVALDRVPEVVMAAIKRAALEDAATVASIRIERPVTILPEPAYGQPRWALAVTSGREQATVYAALDGTIVGADVSGTQRARMFDMLAGDAHLAEAQTDLAAVLDADVRVREVDFSKTGIFVRAENPSKENMLVSYSWNLNGVRRDFFDTPDVDRIVGNEENVAFTFSDLDFSVLPGLKKTALEKLNMDGGAVTGLTAEKRVTGLRAPDLVWIVDVEDTKGEKGQLIADAHGAILDVVEPESRRPKAEWLAGTTVRATLDRIFAKFPKGAKFSSILINDDQAHVDAEDPVKPGEMASFIVDSQAIKPFGTPIPPEVFGLESGPARMFTADDMAGYDAATLDTLKQRTLARINLPGGKVSRLTFERGNVFVASPHGKVLVEIRVEAGYRGGRVTYEPDGTELDVVLP